MSPSVYLRFLNRKEQREAEEAARKAIVRRNQFRGLRRQFERLLPNSRAQLILLAVSFAMGLYAYMKANSEYPVR